MEVVRVYMNADLRCGIVGLKNHLQAKRVAVSQMQDTDFVFFLNRSKTQFKLLWAQNYLITYKAPKGKVTLEALQKIPLAFRNAKITGRGNSLEAVERFLNKAELEHDGTRLRVV
jgi:hypothetical protein